LTGSAGGGLGSRAGCDTDCPDLHDDAIEAIAVVRVQNEPTGLGVFGLVRLAGMPARRRVGGLPGGSGDVGGHDIGCVPLLKQLAGRDHALDSGWCPRRSA